MIMLDSQCTGRNCALLCCTVFGTLYKCQKSNCKRHTPQRSVAANQSQLRLCKTVLLHAALRHAQILQLPSEPTG
jgi:hypothetical protein